MTYLDIELGDFVEPLEGAAFGLMLATVAKLTLPHKAPSEEKPTGFFCQLLGAAPTLRCGSDTMRWERVATAFLAAIGKSNAEFPFMFHIDIVQKGTRKPIKVRDGVLRVPSIKQLEIRMRTLSNRSSFNSIIDAPVGFLDVSVDHPECRVSAARPLPIDTTRNYLVARMATNISLRPAYGTLLVTATRNVVESSASVAKPNAADGLKEDVHHAGDRLEAPADAQIVSDLPPLAEPRSSIRVDAIIVELPITVGEPASRLAAVGVIAAAVAAHAFDIGELGQHPDAAWIQAAAIFVTVALALFVGLKPQAGD